MPIKYYCVIDQPAVDISHPDPHVFKMTSSVVSLSPTITTQSLFSHEPASITTSQNPSLGLPQHLSSQDTASTPVTRPNLLQSDPLHLSSHDTAGRTSRITPSNQPAGAGCGAGDNPLTVKLWDFSSQTGISGKAAVSSQSLLAKPKTCQQSLLTWADNLSPQIEPVLPFSSVENLSDVCGPAKPILKPRYLKDVFFSLPNGAIFLDKELPSPSVNLTEHERFDAKYYISLYEQTAAAGVRGQYKWPENTPNYIGARGPTGAHNFQPA